MKFTPRVLRMMCVEFVILCAVCCYALHFWVLILPVLVLLSWALCLPADIAIGKKFLRLACEKLRQSDLTVIAITGSYGKTSTKDMLCALLDKSIAPMGSCNTPLGIAKFINNTDLAGYEYLILEFGARKKGDIEELMHLYAPSVGVVTGVCEQHMSTFKTWENLLATKCELVIGLPADGFCVLADKSVHDFATVGDCKKYLKTGVRICDKRLEPSGTKFTLIYGRKSAEVSIPQVAQYGTDTFALSLFVCLKLGQSFEKTVDNAQFVKQTDHRMQIIYNGFAYIVDDSYNGSIKGVESCCKTLVQFGSKKIAVSQGIVECGKKRREMNVLCGQMLGEVCDVLIFTGKNSKYLCEGARNAHCETVIIAKNLNAAVKLAQPYIVKDCFLLFQNDLPDVANV
ncbi:MAG: Mur ligase family protein [Corallococcus sp.]|nr:Mur ligase family protein [Corallococcus sp.]MCM1359225.1 Mur ligase family protein [Corallococcus sp.]MCM1394616.1 Mur ligase family protein [Corallococcus sp.]